MPSQLIALAQTQLIIGDSGWGHMDHDGGWWVVMAVGMVLFWAIVIAGAMWLVREFGRRPGGNRGGSGGENSVAVLERRLAAGEIDVQEYDERLERLTR